VGEPIDHQSSKPLDNSVSQSIKEKNHEQNKAQNKEENQTLLNKSNTWETRYGNPIAKQQINWEAIYLGVLLFLIPVLMYLIWIGYVGELLNLDNIQIISFNKYALAWLGGSLGGTLFAIKWLYHSVAKYEWYQDRLYWRLFSPHLSAALSFAIITLISSGILKIFDQSALRVPSTVVGLSFLCGYFSDSAIAKMTEVANTMFGTMKTK
jgi:hypothetical protein